LFGPYGSHTKQRLVVFFGECDVFPVRYELNP
jgi:hypothetical protein